MKNVFFTTQSGSCLDTVSPRVIRTSVSAGAEKKGSDTSSQVHPIAVIKSGWPVV